MNKLSQELDFELSPARHEDPTAPYHLGLHEVVCTGFQWDRKIHQQIGVKLLAIIGYYCVPIIANNCD
jgi:hypothetical protein